MEGIVDGSPRFDCEPAVKWGRNDGITQALRNICVFHFKNVMRWDRIVLQKATKRTMKSIPGKAYDSYNVQFECSCGTQKEENGLYIFFFGGGGDIGGLNWPHSGNSKVE